MKPADVAVSWPLTLHCGVGRQSASSSTPWLRTCAAFWRCRVVSTGVTDSVTLAMASSSEVWK